MTKTIKNITPRPVESYEIAYMTDVEELESSLSAKITDIGVAIGGENWEISSSINLNGSIFVNAGAATVVDGLNVVGTVIGDPTSANYITGASIYQDLQVLDSKAYDADQLLSYIVNGFGSNFTSDSAGVWTFQTANLSNATNLTEAFEIIDSAMGKLPDDGTFLYISPWNDICTNLMSLDYGISAVSDIALNALSVATSVDYFLAYAMDGATGDYYNSGWGQFDFNQQGIMYITGATNVAQALVSLDAAIQNTYIYNAITLSSTAGTGNVATVYDLMQGGVSIGTINIPKDFLVKSAALSTVSTANVPYQGAVVGDKYIDFVVNTREGTDTAEHIYLPVNDLVDVYTAQQNATQVQLAIGANNVISASIVAGSIGTTELANGAVTTAKIADGAVTTSKIKLVDTSTAEEFTLQVTDRRLQLVQIV